MDIGVIGQGFVGSAIKEGLKDFYNVRGYDLDENKCFNLKNNTRGLEETVINSDIIFFCLPTPMRKDGRCDTRILEKAIDDAYKIIEQNCPDPKYSDFVQKEDYKKTFVIKSTVPPGTTERIGHKYPMVNTTFSPEFLTEANSFKDFKNQSRIIIGGEGAEDVKKMFKKPFPAIPIIVTHSKTAEMVKYFINCFLATKVIFANQMYDICQFAGIDYDNVCEYALYDNRIGKSHLAVPGPDGDRGFGGHCFPKDLLAMIKFADHDEVENQFLIDVESANDYYRKDRDWEKMKGRAVSDD